MKKSNNKGFSLVELLIVIAIMAVIAGALVPRLLKYIGKSKRSVDVNNAYTFATSAQNAISNYELDTHYNPSVFATGCTWDQTTTFNTTNPTTLLDYFAVELGQLPVSKSHKDYYWVVEFQDFKPKAIYLTKNLNQRHQIELWPNGQDYIDGK